MDLKTGVATHCERLERRSPKCAYTHVHIDFSSEMVTSIQNLYLATLYWGKTWKRPLPLERSAYVSVCVYACVCVLPRHNVLLGLCLPLIWWVRPSHHFEVTAKWPVASGCVHLANAHCVFVCVFASLRLIDTKWYRVGAHQRWPSQLTDTAIYSFGLQYLHCTSTATPILEKNLTKKKKTV